MCLRHKDSFKTVRDIDELKLQSARSTILRRGKNLNAYTSKHLFTTIFPEKKNFPRKNSNEIPHHRCETTQKTKITKRNSS